MKFLLGSGVVVACLLGLSLAAPQEESTASPTTDFIVLKHSTVPVEENDSSTTTTTRPFAEDCQEYCSHTYPQHTYSEPANFKACTAGCRSAQLDAFISWPLQTSPGKCEAACQEMYTSEDQRYACTTGCHTPTIDSSFPNRDHLYVEEDGGNVTNPEISIMLPPIKETISYFFSSFFGNPVGFDDLTEHAQSMEVLVVPYLRSDVTVLTNDGVYSYREYSFDNGAPVFGSLDEPPKSSSSMFPTGQDNGGWVSVYKRPGNSNCVWMLHRAALNKMLMVVGVGLIVAALTSCLLSACKSSSRQRNRPKISAMKTAPPLSTVKKAPYDLGHQFALPEKVKLDNVKITLL